MKILASEIFEFTYKDKTETFTLYELEDGFWRVTCKVEDFVAAMGTSDVDKAEGLSEVVSVIGKGNEALMTAMWAPFQQQCDEATAKYRNCKLSYN